MQLEGKVISKRGKKVVKWGPGMAVLITKEAKLIGWNTDTFLRLLVVNDGKQKRIILEEIGRV